MILCEPIMRQSQIKSDHKPNWFMRTGMVKKVIITHFNLCIILGNTIEWINSKDTLILYALL